MDAQLLEDLKALHAASFGWALANCRWDRTEAEDVLQEAYLKVADGRARYGGRAALKTWFFGVVRRTAREHRRRRDRRSVLLSLIGPPLEEPPTPPDAAFAASERSRRVTAAVGALPRRQREVVHLVLYGDLSVAEAGEVMGVSVGAARQHYARGKAALAARLTAEVDDDGRS